MELMALCSSVGKSVVAVYSVATVICSLVAVAQERKIWRPPNMPSLSVGALVKVFLFNVLWIFLCTLFSFMVLFRYIFSVGSLDIKRECNCWVERNAALLCCRLIGKVKIIGTENLPADENQVPAPVYIANHASQIDLGVVYFINRRFKWIAKKSVLYVPGVGATMFLGDHVLIDRVKGRNKNSVSSLFVKSDAAVQSGIPMFLFPQGTRVMAKRLPFKDGAFVIAQNNKSPIVPISIEIPLNAWESWFPLIRSDCPVVVITIHPPIEVTGKEDREALKKKCFDQIYSCLPKIWVAED